jgi:hypothetical protein
MRVVLSPHGDGSRMQPTGTRKEGSNGFSACSSFLAGGQRRGHRPSRARCDLPVRAVGFPDLLIAAVAEREQLTLLHYDSDYDLVHEITQQPMQWVVPRGTVP